MTIWRWNLKQLYSERSLRNTGSENSMAFLLIIKNGWNWIFVGKHKTNPYYRFSINEPKTINEQAVDRELDCPVVLLQISDIILM
jgi:hypothetical protein